MKRHHVLFGILAVSINILLLVSIPKLAYAGIEFLNVPFGGTVTKITPCIGGGLYLATVLVAPLKTPTDMVFTPTIFSWGLIDMPGQSVLGFFKTPTFCATSIVDGNLTGPVVPLVTFYGSSKI